MISKRAPATLVGALLAFSACAPTRLAPPAPAPAVAASPVVSGPGLLGESVNVLNASVYAARRDILGTASYDLPMEANSWVEAELDFLVGQRREVIGAWLARGDYYGDFVQGVLRANGVPTDLYHLAMIESGFQATAKSRVGAMGFWQLMPATGRALGLRVDTLVDERIDPVRSTRAAARHLKDLRRELGDWSLATAAYNAGSGRIGRGLRAYGARDFWDLAQRGDLAAETKQYVPRLYAVTVIGRDRERFGFRHAGAGGFAFDSIQVEYATPLAELARLGNTSEAELAQLNPHLLRGTTPAGGYWVWVPAGKGMALQRAWLASDFRKEQGYGSYAVRDGDTLGRLAELSGVRSARIRDLNPLTDLDDLQIGEPLRFPFRAAQELNSRPVRKRREEPHLATRRGSSTHTVESGETLSEIALRFGVSVDELRTANEMESSTIRSGQELRIPPSVRADSVKTASPKTALKADSVKADSTRSEGSKAKAAKTAKAEEKGAEHVVRTGESLWAIARQYGSSVEAIEDANHLAGKAIQPGQRLTVPGTD